MKSVTQKDQRNDARERDREAPAAAARGEGNEHLEDRYRPIGISSVAAAARYQQEPQKAPRRVSTLAWLRDDSVA